jgi:hypothetical protein
LGQSEIRNPKSQTERLPDQHKKSDPALYKPQNKCL